MSENKEKVAEEKLEVTKNGPNLGKLHVKVVGSNGRKFVVFRGNVSYEVWCCDQPAGMDHNTRELLCRKCGNRMPQLKAK